MFFLSNIAPKSELCTPSILKEIIATLFIFDPYIIIKRKNFKIGVVGLSSSFDSKEVIVLDPISTLGSVIREIENKVDLVILLFNATQQDLTKL